MLPKEIIIFDTEYTAWKDSEKNGWSKPNEYKEVVQIAAIKVDTDSLQELETFEYFVKPKINPILSDYFKNLTKITQEEVDEYGISFHEAFTKFKKFINNTHCYSFGGDERELKINCELSNISYVLSDNQFFDMRKYFIEQGIDAQNYNSGNITEVFGVKKLPNQHNALNDCRSIIQGLILLNERLKN